MQWAPPVRQTPSGPEDIEREGAQLVSDEQVTNRPDPRPTDHVKTVPVSVAQRSGSANSVLAGLLPKGEN